MSLLFQDIFKALSNEYGVPDSASNESRNAETNFKGCVESQEDAHQELDEKTQQNKDNIPNNVSEDVAEQEVEEEVYDNKDVHFTVDETGTAKNVVATTNETEVVKKKRCHKLFPPCNCKRKCFEQIGEPRRNEIFEDFWKMSYNERKSWTFFRVEVTATNRHRPRINESSRSRTMQYYFSDGDGLKQQVCQLFFLQTLGYSNNTVLKVIFENTDPSALQPARDKKRETWSGQ